MTRDLAWGADQARDEIFRIDRYEGIRVHDWDAFEDPFRLTVDAYWKYQGEKERKLYADRRVRAEQRPTRRERRALRQCAQALHPGRDAARILRAPRLRAPGASVRRRGVAPACLFQSVDEIRHFQTETHSISHFNKYFNGMHHAPHWFDRVVPVRALSRTSRMR